VDVERQVRYWRESAQDDLEAAVLLLDNGKVNQGLFFAHLALEKALKAIVCRASLSTPPPIHNLPKLADLSKLVFTAEQQRLLAQVSAFHLRGRYELPVHPLISEDEARSLFGAIEELALWLTSR
jgi:HEPN domain-containing protein